MKLYVWLGLLFLALVEIYSLMPVAHPPFEVGTLDKPSYLTGAIHVHSNYGEGTSSIPEIAAAAQESKLDFVVITDLDSAKSRRDGFEHAYNNVDAFVEMEANTPGGHLLSFYSTSEARDWKDERVIQASWNHFLGKEPMAEMFTVIAHPSNIKNPWLRFDRFADGVEVVNFDSTWRREYEESLPSFGLTVLLYGLNEYLSGLRFSQIYPKDLSSWDAMNAFSKNHFGILGHDVRARLKLHELGSIPWPSYNQAFRFASNVVYYDPPLAKDFEARKRQIYRSLREGRLAIVYHFLDKFEGNDWQIRCGDQTYRSGSHFAMGKQRCQFLIRTAKDFRYPRQLRLYRNGELFQEITTNDSLVAISFDKPGDYRLEVWAKPKSLFRLLLNDAVPYILYNPIYVQP